MQHLLFLLACRKGCATYCLSFPSGPTAVAVYLRARWSLGVVQIRYIFAGEGSDQLCGRVACGLPINNVHFSVLPPHFKSTFEISEKEWVEMYCCYEDLPISFKQCMPMLLASLVYHKSWIAENLHPNHPFFHTYIWRGGILDELKNEVVLGYDVCQFTGERNKILTYLRRLNPISVQTETGLKATGIPGTVETLVQVNNVGESVQRTMVKIDESQQFITETIRGNC